MTAYSIQFRGLTLRPFTELDADAFTSAVLESVDTVGRWLPWCTSDYNARLALEWIEFCRNARTAGNAFEFGVFCQESGDFLGGAGLNQVIQQHKFCNLGYWVRQSRQGQGIASRCVEALSTHAFQELGMHRVEIVVAVGNHASERVARKSGALHECVARNRLWIRDQPVAASVFSLVRQG